MSKYLQIRDGYLWYVDESPCWDQPIMRAVCYKLALASNVDHAFDGLPAHWDATLHIVTIDRVVCFDRGIDVPYLLKQARFTLPGDRVADRITEVPIPQPSARGKKLRYVDGEWQRLYARGWKSAR